MSELQTQHVAPGRIALAAVGALGGLSLWYLVDVLEEVLTSRRLLMFLICLTGGFFATLLAMVGPLRLRRAALPALAISLGASLLMVWASGRFEKVGDFIDTMHPVVAFFVLCAVPLPFVIAWLRGDETWRHYPALFNHSWNIVVRYAAAWLFVGVFWALIMLSDTLLQIVGLTIIEDLLDIDAVPFVLTGAVLGLAIAVVNELSDYVSPYLILRLLRLLLPVVTVVIAVFVVALPFRGLGGLFGGLSAAATLIAMAAAGATLVTTALDQSDEEAVTSPAMRGFAQALALLLPVITGFAAYAVWLRVAQYGWTPDRLVAALIAAFGLAYSLFYAVAVLMRQSWMVRIRTANTWLALGLVGAAALWMSPLLNPQRISAASQLARFEAGKTPVEALALWEIGREWGHAGQAVLAQIEALEDHPDQAALEARLARLETAKRRYDFYRSDEEVRAREAATELVEVLPVRFAGAPDDSRTLDFLQKLRGFEVDAAIEGCALQTAAGNPGCVLLFADFQPARAGLEGVLVHRSGGNNLRYVTMGMRDGAFVSMGPPLSLGDTMTSALGEGVIDALIAGEYTLEPTGIQALRLKDRILFIGP